MELLDDFRDLLIELLDAGAEFVVVGGHAVAHHGHPRATKDLDVLVRPDSANAQRVYRALAAFGAPLHAFEVTEADFAHYGGVLQIGLPPRRIDVLNRISGTTFAEAIAEGVSFELEGRRVPVIGLQALLKNKRAERVTPGTSDGDRLGEAQRSTRTKHAAGRAQDIADVQALAKP